jgi:hypothetical protein
VKRSEQKLTRQVSDPALSRFARVALIFMGFHGIGYGTLKLLFDLPSLQP